MSSRASRPRVSRKQRIAAGAVLATTSLLGTYLAAIRPHPTYASTNSGGSELGQGLLGSANVSLSAVTLPTCADVASQDDVVSDDTELRTAIHRSDDDSVICIDGTIDLLAPLPTIDDTTLTLVGDDSTTDGINGGDTHKILTATFSGDDTLIVSNLTLRNALNDQSAAVEFGGAAINFTGAIDSKIMIENSILANNVTNAGRGGALAVLGTGPALTIRNSVFSDNETKGAMGGALYIANGAASGTIENSTFTSNRSLDEGGGAIYAEAPLTIRESTFEDDTAIEGGGAINFNGGGEALTIYDSTFNNNESLEVGGAIYILGSSELHLHSSTFTNNEAGEYGGAVSAGDITALSINDSHFYKNRTAAGSRFYGGGAVFVYAGDRDTNVEISTSSFVTNYADQGQGGALLIRRSGTSEPQVVLEESIFNDNEASNGYGGGLSSNAGLIIRDSVISGNRARKADNFTGTGGGLFLSIGDDSALITNTSIVGNNAEAGAGGILISDPESFGTTFRMINSTVSNNTSDAGYSAMLGYGPILNLEIDYVTFAFNDSDDDSSAVYLRGAGSITNSIFNNVGIEGEAFNLISNPYGSPINVYNSVFTFENSVSLGSGSMTSPTFGFAYLTDLANNGGPTIGSNSFQSYLPTRSVPEGSIAIGAADPALTPDITDDQLGSGRDNRTAGALNGDGSPAPGPTPTPTPATPPSAPRDATAEATDQSSARIRWATPASAGSFPITSYQATTTPGGHTCLVAAPALTCTITGLSTGTSYTAQVRALNGAGWGSTTTTNTFTPRVAKSILITGERDIVRGRNGVRAAGVTTGLVGATVQARVKLAGEVTYRSGSTRTVNADGDFTWQRRTNKKVYVYFTDNDGTRSNRIILPN